MSSNGKKKALVICISEYDDPKIPDLEFCEIDGELMIDALKKAKFSIPDKNILIGKVDFSQFNKAIKDFFRGDVNSDDTLLFYYSGHGVPKGHDEYYFVTSETEAEKPDVNGFPFTMMTSIADNSQSTKKISILDCCYSGGAKMKKSIKESQALIGKNIITEKFVEEGEGSYLLASSLGTQESFGMKDGNGSVFTNYLSRGIKGLEKDATDEYGNVTPEKLGNYVWKEMKNFEQDQRPIRKVEGSGNIFLAHYPKHIRKNEKSQKAIETWTKPSVKPINPYQSLDPSIIQGIKVLRKRISYAHIPNTIKDKTINIASWQLGKSSADVRTINYMAEIISNFDLIAITHQTRKKQELDKVCKLLGSYWKIISSEMKNLSTSTNRLSEVTKTDKTTSISYLFDERTILHTGLKTEIDYNVMKSNDYIPNVPWYIRPYITSFRAGRFDFNILITHPRWSWDRRENIRIYADIARWISLLRKRNYVFDRELLVIGDFSIDRVNSQVYNNITSHGLQVPKVMIAVKGTSLAINQRYNTILHYKQFPTQSSRGGIIDFYNNDWKSLYPKRKYPKMTKPQFVSKLSGQFPVWLNVNIETKDEILDNVLKNKKNTSKKKL